MSNYLAIRNDIEKLQPQIEKALPSHIESDRVVRGLLTELRKNPALMKCSRESLFGAMIQMAQLGLEPGGALGHAYIVPFQGKAQLIIGYRGMIELARRSGSISSITARMIYEGDTYKISQGTEEWITHIPKFESDNWLYVYAVARMKDKTYQFEIMSREQIERVKKSSRVNGGPWKTHPEEMAKKTVVRRLFKYLPVSVEHMAAVMSDDYFDAGISQNNEVYVQKEEGDPWEEITAEIVQDPGPPNQGPN